jgi:hypothetical protein
MATAMATHRLSRVPTKRISLTPVVSRSFKKACPTALTNTHRTRA